MPAETGFPPVARADARVLILGSLPGAESLRTRMYYAHPRNAFWRVMGALFGAGPECPYEERLRRLQDNGAALWDVCAAAERAGSLDAAIVPASIVPNDFVSFFASHRQIRMVACNGAKAAQLYRRLVVPGLAPPFTALPVSVLPSTSPAHAAIPFVEKLARWRQVVGHE